MLAVQFAFHHWLKSRRFTAVAALTLALSVRVSAANGAERDRSNEWLTGTPEEVGLDSAPLAEMFDLVRERGIPVHSVQIVRHGRLVLDAYFYPYSAGTRHDVASVTKSVTSTLIGLAVEKGFLPDVQQSVMSVLQGRVAANLDARKRKLALEHLLTMQAGWDCGFEPREARLFEMRRSADWTRFMLDLPMIAEPGTRWAYCSGNCHLLSAILTQTTGTNALAFARRELFAPLGIHDVVWPADAHGNNHGWGDLQLHPRDMAISEAWVRKATRAHVERTSNSDHYGYFWWVKGKDYPGMFEAVGRGGQRINVWPAKDLVLVFTGGGFEPGDLAPFILKALKSDDKLPANTQAQADLRRRIAEAAQSAAARPVPKLPSIAGLISGKTFNVTANALNLSAVSVKFDGSAEAHAELIWDGHRESYRLGLDGVGRFSTNTLVNLPCNTQGQWLNDNTFLLQLDLVGGINCYRFNLVFGDQGRKLSVKLSERTGLNDEQFDGTASP
ncbi:MAG: 6-aminohexanoate hydrolase [Verrucomicrobia bacterium]|nr:MAG: 6-aminohexanoate hydrolase [Verrucomicrobiota bacterium]